MQLPILGGYRRVPFLQRAIIINLDAEICWGAPSRRDGAANRPFCKILHGLNKSPFCRNLLGAPSLAPANRPFCRKLLGLTISCCGGVSSLTQKQDEQIRGNGQDDGHAPDGNDGFVAISNTKLSKFTIIPVSKSRFHVMEY